MKNKTQPPAIMWFCKDLRLYENPALIQSAKVPIIPLFILDDSDPFKSGRTCQWWLYKSLISLQKALHTHGLKLILRRGDPLKVLQDIVATHKVSSLYWNHCYEPYVMARDKKIKDFFKPHIDCQSFNGSLLTEPWVLKTQAGIPYHVFTSYWKALKDRNLPLSLKGYQEPILLSDDLESWNLRPTSPDWSQGFEKIWVPGEKG